MLRFCRHAPAVTRLRSHLTTRGSAWPSPHSVQAISRDFRFGCPNWHRYTPKPATYGQVFSSHSRSASETVSAVRMQTALTGAPRLRGISRRALHACARGRCAWAATAPAASTGCPGAASHAPPACLLDPRLRGAAPIVEPHHGATGQAQIRHDEADTREQLARMVFDFRHDPSVAAASNCPPDTENLCIGPATCGWAVPEVGTVTRRSPTPGSRSRVCGSHSRRPAPPGPHRSRVSQRPRRRGTPRACPPPAVARRWHMAERRDRLVLDGATFRWDDVPARRWRPDRLQVTRFRVRDGEFVEQAIVRPVAGHRRLRFPGLAQRVPLFGCGERRPTLRAEGCQVRGDVGHVHAAARLRRRARQEQRVEEGTAVPHAAIEVPAAKPSQYLEVAEKIRRTWQALVYNGANSDSQNGIQGQWFTHAGYANSSNFPGLIWPIVPCISSSASRSAVCTAGSSSC